MRALRLPKTVPENSIARMFTLSIPPILKWSSSNISVINPHGATSPTALRERSDHDASYPQCPPAIRVSGDLCFFAYCVFDAVGSAMCGCSTSASLFAKCRAALSLL